MDTQKKDYTEDKAKETHREGEGGWKQAEPKMGEDISDKPADTGDEADKPAADVGDDWRKGLGSAGDELRPTNEPSQEPGGIDQPEDETPDRPTQPM